jgi:hypothetical protein
MLEAVQRPVDPKLTPSADRPARRRLAHPIPIWLDAADYDKLADALEATPSPPPIMHAPMHQQPVQQQQSKSEPEDKSYADWYWPVLTPTGLV